MSVSHIHCPFIILGDTQTLFLTGTGGDVGASVGGFVVGAFVAGVKVGGSVVGTSVVGDNVVGGAVGGGVVGERVVGGRVVGCSVVGATVGGFVVGAFVVGGRVVGGGFVGGIVVGGNVLGGEVLGELCTNITAGSGGLQNSSFNKTRLAPLWELRVNPELCTFTSAHKLPDEPPPVNETKNEQPILSPSGRDISFTTKVLFSIKAFEKGSHMTLSVIILPVVTGKSNLISTTSVVDGRDS
mmetsp:Transcript_14120/g.15618  ORF Transcript_14120/g.15618 Transcript_14120/m.15618 type:complete len:241 (+) Transcript_14120:571-1293(+)|eukprot:CAMPEP_0168537974 /NCGR_PEP_ID=MMETSP0405-20121227/20757_1 /TAXON_ID=498012 /ORGANISM="Trichosphaerium sp, Strain Am-I-7 wt" /LENGTH=240 /DNA_ID=CAMNT_0008566859 /DNA_START=126 /DNA_END=848 /DNA_ORIENTATION=+